LLVSVLLIVSKGNSIANFDSPPDLS